MMFQEGDRVKIIGGEWFESRFRGRTGTVRGYRENAIALHYDVEIDGYRHDTPLPFGESELTKIEEETE